MKNRISNAQAIKPKADLNLGDSLCEYLGAVVTTHTNTQPPVLFEHKDKVYKGSIFVRHQNGGN